MLQRKQSVFLFVAFVLSVVCLCLPVGQLEPSGMGIGPKVYNLWISGNGYRDFSACPLFVLLSLSGLVSIVTVFLYRNRMLQSKMCVCNIFLLLAWYVVYVVLIKKVASPDATFHVSFALCLPMISILLNLMARKGILNDEKLVRAADRIR